MASYYKHSGKISLFGLVGGAFAGLALSLALGPFYGLVLVYNPSAYLGILLPVLLSGALGFGVAFTMKKLGSRNAWVPPLMALATAALTLFISWPSWFAVMLWREGAGQDALFAFWPPSFLELLAGVYAEGAWTIGSSGGAVSGLFLGFVWLCETVIVLGVAPVIALTVAGDGIYCEQCQRWCRRVPSELRLDVSQVGQIAQRLEQGDLNVLTETPRTPDAEDVWAAVALDHCEGCGETNTLLVENVTRGRDARGNQTFHRAPIVRFMLITKDQAAWARRAIYGETP